MLLNEHFGKVVVPCTDRHGDLGFESTNVNFWSWARLAANDVVHPRKGGILDSRIGCRHAAVVGTRKDRMNLLAYAGVVSVARHEHEERYEPIKSIAADKHFHLGPLAQSKNAERNLEQFFLGGPLYCDGCFEKAPTCTDCGWHIDTQRFSEHHRQAHRD